jgi:hypothetical protein
MERNMKNKTGEKWEIKIYEKALCKKKIRKKGIYCNYVKALFGKNSG